MAEPAAAPPLAQDRPADGAAHAEGPPPPPPPPPLCTVCGRGTGDLGPRAATAISMAVDRAVAAAFEKLQPALLRAMAECSAQLARDTAGGSGGCGGPSAAGARAEQPGGPRRPSWVSGMSGNSPRSDVSGMEGHAELAAAAAPERDAGARGEADRPSARSSQGGARADRASSRSDASRPSPSRSEGSRPSPRPSPRRYRGVVRAEALDMSMFANLWRTTSSESSEGPSEASSKCTYASRGTMQRFTVDSQGSQPPTVRSLQADAAMAVLEQSTRFRSAIARRPGAVPPLRRPSFNFPETEDRPSITQAPALRRPSSVVPEPDDLRPATEMSPTQSRRDRHMTSSQLFLTRCDELAQAATVGTLPAAEQPSENESAQRVPSVPEVGRVAPLVLFIFGILPWTPGRKSLLAILYQCLMWAIVSLACVAFLMEGLGHFASQDSLHAGCSACWLGAGFLSQLPLPIGTVMVLALSALRQEQQALGVTFAVVRCMSSELQYQDWRIRWAFRDRAVFLMLWVLIVVMSAAGQLLVRSESGEPAPGVSVLKVCLTAVFSSFVLCLSYGVSHICRSLSAMIDAFCCDVFAGMRPADVAHVWNLTQAVLRKASIAVEKSLLVLCLVVALEVPLLLLDVGMVGTLQAPIVILVPPILVTCSVLYVLLLASTISEQCSRIPALVNALSFGDGTERDRQHIVDYITSSAAGFYVFGMRLTSAMIAKFLYLWCIVVVGLLTNLGSD